MQRGQLRRNYFQLVKKCTYGYQITAGDVLEAYSSILNAASAAGVAEAQIKVQIRDLITEDDSGNNIILATLRDKLIV